MVPELSLIIFGTTVLGSVIIAFMYQKVKELFNLHDTIATIGAFVFGGLLGFLANLAGLVEGSIIYSILQGLVSAWVATGGYDLIKKLSGK